MEPISRTRNAHESERIAAFKRDRREEERARRAQLTPAQVEAEAVEFEKAWLEQEAVWKADKDSEGREYATRTNRSIIAAAQAVRIKTFAWAESMVEPMERARAAAIVLGRPGSFRAMAKWLTENGYTTSNGHAGFGPQTVSNLLGMATDNYKQQAVLECRTRMTAVALSADFTKADEALEGLEADCVRVLTDAIKLAARLNGKSAKDVEANDLLYRAQALREAREIAESQRNDKPMDMEAREAIWKEARAYSVKRIFGDR